MIIINNNNTIIMMMMMTAEIMVAVSNFECELELMVRRIAFYS